jgi:hypothetical protein
MRGAVAVVVLALVAIGSCGCGGTVKGSLLASGTPFGDVSIRPTRCVWRAQPLGVIDLSSDAWVVRLFAHDSAAIANVPARKETRFETGEACVIRKYAGIEYSYGSMSTAGAVHIDCEEGVSFDGHSTGEAFSFWSEDNRLFYVAVEFDPTIYPKAPEPPPPSTAILAPPPPPREPAPSPITPLRSVRFLDVERKAILSTSCAVAEKKTVGYGAMRERRPRPKLSMLRFSCTMDDGSTLAGSLQCVR